MDDNQYSYMKDKMERERQHRPRLIRPLEEVMEEEQTSQIFSSNNSLRQEEMEVEEAKNILMRKDSPTKNNHGASYFTPYLGIGPSGLSPLVLSDPRVAVSFNPDRKHLKTGIGFHSAMLKHLCHCENTKNHPENPERYLILKTKYKLILDYLDYNLFWQD